MCMISAGLTKDFGVLGADSAMHNISNGETTFETGKLSFVRGKYLMAFIGTNLYFSRIDFNRFDLEFKQVSLYLSDYLKGIKEDVEKELALEIKDKDDRKPHFCLYLLGTHNNKPMLAQFNSFRDFEARYLWSENGVKFSNIVYGDNTEKNDVFKASVSHMEELSKKYENPSPGIVGEILTRGIYKKADLEEKIGDKKKYAGGVVNCGVVFNNGAIRPLSGLEVIYGR